MFDNSYLANNIISFTIQINHCTDCFTTTNQSWEIWLEYKIKNHFPNFFLRALANTIARLPQFLFIFNGWNISPY